MIYRGDDDLDPGDFETNGPELGDRFWGHFDDVKAEVEYTALVSVEVDLETGDVASVGIHPTRDEDETPSEVTVSLGVASLLLRFCCGVVARGSRSLLPARRGTGTAALRRARAASHGSPRRDAEPL
jgi:hypothetical protein